jgi:hypothetical protein
VIATSFGAAVTLNVTIHKGREYLGGWLAGPEGSLIAMAPLVSGQGIRTATVKALDFDTVWFFAAGKRPRSL